MMKGIAHRRWIFGLSAVLAAAPAAAASLPAGPIEDVATFRQKPPAKGTPPKVLYYKNEDVIKTTSTTTKTPVYTTVVTPVYTTVKTPIYDSKGNITGYTSTKVQTGTTTTQKLTSYTYTTTKSTAITPQSRIFSTADGTSTTPGAAPALVTILRTPAPSFASSLAGEQASLFSFSATSTSAPVLTGNLFSQSFGPGTLSLMRTTPVGAALSKLLTVSFDSIELLAAKGGSQFLLTAKSPTSNISYLSDFFGFTRPGQDVDYQFSLLGSGASPFQVASIDPSLTNVTGARSLASFRGNVSGVFGASAVPEPATWAMMILGFGAIGSSMRYRRRTTRVAAMA